MSTLKLYYAPGTCSLSPHIVLIEAGLSFEIERVDIRAKKTASGTDFLTINPKGYVPSLRMADGGILTEGAAIVQYIADLVADKSSTTSLAPSLTPLLAPVGSLARYRAIEWLTYVSSELHKSFSPLFSPATSEESKLLGRAALVKKFTWVDSQLAGKSYLLGDHFSVADAYLFTVYGWSAFVKLDLSGLENLTAYIQRVAQRPAVIQALAAEAKAGA